jgi:hypothetical protein
LGEEKTALFARIFSAFDFDNPAFKEVSREAVYEAGADIDGETGAEWGAGTLTDEDYFIFYDDTVYDGGKTAQARGTAAGASATWG